MKKALALVLALVLALSMAVSAFGLTITNLDEVILNQVTSSAGTKTVITNSVDLFKWDNPETAAVDTIYRTIDKPYHNGVFYLVVDNEMYDEIEVSHTGNTTIEEVEYDPDKMVWLDAAGNEEIRYEVVDWNGGKPELVDWYVVHDQCFAGYFNGNEINECLYIDAAKSFAKWNTLEKLEYTLDAASKEKITITPDDVAAHLHDNAVITLTDLDYEEAKAYEKELDLADKTTEYKTVPMDDVTILKVTVAANYTAHFTEGTFTVEAIGTGDKGTVEDAKYKATIRIISDVVIFDYEEVKSAATYGTKLLANSKLPIGYSDYETYVNGYKQADLDTVTTKPGVSVVSTTAFRAIEGKDLTIICGTEESHNRITVEMEDIAAGQKGINFYAYGDNAKTTDAYEFGFYGDQVVNSKTTITFTPGEWDGEAFNGMTWFDLREYFGVKVEEEDRINYYLVKDGKHEMTIEVDYMYVDYNDIVEVEVELEAGETLGQYEIVLEVPAEEEAPAEEENPNTGAESVVGVVAALAVVSLASAAAVSLKK